MPSPQDILSIDRAEIATFIQKQASAKTLSRLVKGLNGLLLSDDEDTRHLAARALDHLGFPAYA